MARIVVNETPNEPLEVGRLLGDTFSIFFKRFPALFLLCAIPTFVGFGVSMIFYGSPTNQFNSGTGASEAVLALLGISSLLIFIALFVICSAMVKHICFPLI